MALSHPSIASTHDYRVPAMHLNALDWIALVLMIVGSVNWGLVGVLNLDLVAAIFGTMTPAARVVYALVGLAGIYGILLAAKCARKP